MNQIPTLIYYGILLHTPEKTIIFKHFLKLKIMFYHFTEVLTPLMCFFWGFFLQLMFAGK